MENGDSIFRYVYAPTQKELSAKLRQHIDSYQDADLTEQSRMTLGEWLDEHIQLLLCQNLFRAISELWNCDLLSGVAGDQMSLLCRLQGLVEHTVDTINGSKFTYGPKQILTEEQLDVFMKVIAEDFPLCPGIW